MRRWIRVVAAAEIPPGTGRPVRAGDRWIAVFNVDGAFAAIDDACPHRGASLGEGAMLGGRVVCPWHAWTFDLATGRAVRMMDVRVATYPTRRVGGDVEVELPD